MDLNAYLCPYQTFGDSFAYRPVDGKLTIFGNGKVEADVVTMGGHLDSPPIQWSEDGSRLLVSGNSEKYRPLWENGFGYLVSSDCWLVIDSGNSKIL